MVVPVNEAYQIRGPGPCFRGKEPAANHLTDFSLLRFPHTSSPHIYTDGGAGGNSYPAGMPTFSRQPASCLPSLLWGAGDALGGLCVSEALAKRITAFVPPQSPPMDAHSLPCQPAGSSTTVPLLQGSWASC